MPRAKQQKPQQSETRGTSGGNTGQLPTFVRCELSDAERDYCKSSLLSLGELSGRIEDLLSEGYKLSLSYDDNSDCVLTVLTAKADNSTNRGLALSARGATLEGAITVLFYKHFERLKEDWSSVPTQGRQQQWG